METFTITANKREGKTKASQLRKEGVIPALIYNHGTTDQLQVQSSDLRKLFAHGVSESTLIDVKWDGKSETAFIKDYQIHPVTDDFLHVDFYRITAGEKIKTKIPIQLEGKANGVKEGGVLEVFLHDIEIEIFPRFLVPALTVDISNLEIGDNIHIDDIKLPEESQVLVDGNPIVCQVSSSAKLDAELDQIDSDSEAAAAEQAADSETATEKTEEKQEDQDKTDDK